MANGPLACDCIGTNAGERELLRFFCVLKIGLVNSASLLREVLCNMMTIRVVPQRASLLRRALLRTAAEIVFITVLCSTTYNTQSPSLKLVLE